uniref:Uncharacterized protein n=1 Tax=Ananas comosus var. bracteatus TaxID=296719 RepID=A0A6V7PAK0_ANACO|nr:unnamed protein product [Ananas comosus var. bracteatus]
MFPRILLIPASSSSSLLFHPFRLYARIHMRMRALDITALNNDDNNSNSIDKRQLWSTRSFFNPAPVLLALALVLSPPRPSPDAFSNVPQTLSGDDARRARIQRPKSRKAESCTAKCVGTCIRGGAGSPAKAHSTPLVVFKQGFRTRQYCLVECSDICNLIKDGDDGP